jgi:hypothetical protein
LQVPAQAVIGRGRYDGVEVIVNFPVAVFGAGAAEARREKAAADPGIFHWLRSRELF